MRLSDITDRLRRRRACSRTVRALSSLDKRVLDDIGVNRDAIPALAARIKC